MAEWTLSLQPEKLSCVPLTLKEVCIGFKVDVTKLQVNCSLSEKDDSQPSLTKLFFVQPIYIIRPSLYSASISNISVISLRKSKWETLCWVVTRIFDISLDK